MIKDMEAVVKKLEQVSPEELIIGVPLLLNKVQEIEHDVKALVEDLNEFYAILMEILDEDNEYDQDAVENLENPLISLPFLQMGE